MESVKCSTCHEHSRPASAPVASLSTAKEPWKCLGIDVKEVHDPVLKQKHKYLVMVDEASRLVRCKLLFSIPEKSNRNVITKELIECFEEEWESLFGIPETLRHDPEGSMNSTEILQELCAKGIKLTATAGEAHWQLGIVERTIQTIFTTAAKLRDSQKIPMTRAVQLSVSAHNTTERVHGYTPAQWAFGRNPSWDNTMFEEQGETTNLARDSSESFLKKLSLQQAARSVFEQEILRQKIQRAQRAKHRKDLVFCPGDSVFIWRQGTHKLKGSFKTGIHKGAWFGPGMVLGTESKVHEGTVIPSAVVWVVINDRLWRCAPEQIRRSSEREVSEYILNQKKPWTFENVTKDLILGQYRDLTQDAYPEFDPDEEMDEEAVHEPEAPDADVDEPVEMNTDRKGQKRPTGANGTRYTKKMKQDANLKQAINFATNARRHIETAFFSKEETPDTVIEIALPFF